MANALKTLQELLGNLDQNRAVYEKGNDVEIRRRASNFVGNLGEETPANNLMDYDHAPIEFAQEQIEIERGALNLQLENLVENRFDEVLGCKEITEDILAESLLSYVPKKDVKKEYRGIAKAHKAQRNIRLHGMKDQVDPRLSKSALSQMTAEVREHYEKNPNFNPEKGDSEQVKHQKAKLRSWFIRFVIGRDVNNPREEGLLVRDKYAELHADDLAEFNKKLDSKAALVKYVKATLPEDSNSRMGYLKAIAGGYE